MLGEFGSQWPRAIAISAIAVTCLLTLGLFNWRRRAQRSGVLARMLVALVVSACAIAMLSYTFPSRHPFRGAEVLAVILIVCGALVLPSVFAASNLPKDARRQLSLEIRGPTPKSKNIYLLLLAFAAALAILVLLQKVS